MKIEKSKKPSMLLLVPIFLLCGYYGYDSYNMLQIVTDPALVQLRTLVLGICIATPIISMCFYGCIYRYWKALNHWEEKFNEQEEAWTRIGKDYYNDRK